MRCATRRAARHQRPSGICPDGASYAAFLGAGRLLAEMQTSATNVLMPPEPNSVSQTANTSAQADPLQQACLLVGRFQYHFARIEQKIDQGVIKLLDLDDKAGPIVTGSVDFAKKLNLLWAVAYEHATNDTGREFVDRTCKDVFAVNIDR